MEPGGGGKRGRQAGGAAACKWGNDFHFQRDAAHTPTAGHARVGARGSLGHGVPSHTRRRGRLGRVRCRRRSYVPAPLVDLRSGEIDRSTGLDRSIGRAARRGGPRLLGNRGCLPSNAAAHVACWRSVPVVLGRGGMCAMPTAHLARRMQQ